MEGTIVTRAFVIGLALVAGWAWWLASRGPDPARTRDLPEAASPAGLLELVPVVRVADQMIPQSNTSPAKAPARPDRATNSSLATTTTAGGPALKPLILEAQLSLARRGFSPGPLDGLLGSQTRAAMLALFSRAGTTMPAESNAVAEVSASLDTATFTNYVVTTNDLARLLPLGKTWLAKSQQARLDYETLLELIAERFWSHPSLVRRLNPGMDWTNIVAGATLKVPNVEPPPVQGKAAMVKILLRDRLLQAFDENTNLLVHFPCSIAQRVEKRPVGERLEVVALAEEPNYTFDPEVFPESIEAQQIGHKLILQPGPNNPVGTVWIGLDKPGYGIHGTPRPEEVGRTESHGCFRLANWNAELLFKLVWIGLPVFVEP